MGERGVGGRGALRVSHHIRPNACRACVWGLMSMQLGKGPTRIWACCMGQVASMALHDGGNPVRWRELKNAPLHGCNTICQGPQAAIQIISVIGNTT